MKKLLIMIAMLGVLLIAGALPAAASDGALLGSGSVAPAAGGQAAAPVQVAQATSTTGVAGQDVLAYTGLDSGVALLLGVGLTAAGAAAVVASRKRARA